MVSVSRVLDGDTVELAGGQRVRYIGIDTPETRKKTATGWVEVNEPFAQEAKALNEALVGGKSVRLELDVEKRDKYSRLLAYCFVDTPEGELFVQAELLRRGLAYLYTFAPNVKHVGELVEALKEARREERGVWSVDLDIPSSEADQFLGQRRLVTGFVRSVRRSRRTTRLLMTGFNIVIFNDDLGLFEREGIDPTVFYQGKKVRVFGLIKKYRGVPEVVIADPWQIEVLL